MNDRDKAVGQMLVDEMRSVLEHLGLREGEMLARGGTQQPSLDWSG